MDSILNLIINGQLWNVQCQEDIRIPISDFTREKQIKKTEFDGPKGSYRFVVVHFISPSIYKYL